MWITERNGKYVFQERFKDPVTGQHKVLTTTRSKNTKQEQRAAREYLTQKWESYFPGANLRLSDLIDRYLDAKGRINKPQTIIGQRATYNTIVKLIGNAKANTLTAAYVRDKFLASGKKPKTINIFIARIRALYYWAYANDYVQSDALAKKLQTIPDQERKAAPKYLEHDEVQKLLDACDLEYYNLLFRFLLLTGLRFGEAVALSISDVDLKTRTITISKNISRQTKKTGTPKTKASIRTIRIQPELLALCHDILKYTRRQVMLNAGDKSAFLVNDFGQRINYDAAYMYLRKKSGRSIGRTVGLHIFRHTHVSFCAEQGMSIAAISRRLGHDDSEITKQIYFHVTEKQREKDFDEIDQIVLLTSC